MWAGRMINWRETYEHPYTFAPEHDVEMREYPDADLLTGELYTSYALLCDGVTVWAGDSRDYDVMVGWELMKEHPQLVESYHPGTSLCLWARAPKADEVTDLLADLEPEGAPDVVYVSGSIDGRFWHGFEVSDAEGEYVPSRIDAATRERWARDRVALEAKRAAHMANAERDARARQARLMQGYREDLLNNRGTWTIICALFDGDLRWSVYNAQYAKDAKARLRSYLHLQDRRNALKQENTAAVIDDAA